MWTHFILFVISCYTEFSLIYKVQFQSEEEMTFKICPFVGQKNRTDF